MAKKLEKKYDKRPGCVIVDADDTGRINGLWLI